MVNDARSSTPFPTGAAIFFGLGIGGFFDGIVFHQLLQWHHMATSGGYPVHGVEDASQALENMKLNTILDGLFHLSNYIFVLVGLAWLWRTSRRAHLRWSTKPFVGGILTGFGLFNVVEGIVNHHLLGLHHVNETVPRAQWIYWDIGFLLWGAVMIAIGWGMMKARKQVQS